MLKHSKYLDVIKSTTLTAVDLLVVKNNKLLLGLRNNEPAKNYLFTPGCRTYKNETLNNAIQRVGQKELGIKIDLDKVKLVGVYDHIYPNNFSNNDFGTHYVVSAYSYQIDNELDIKMDDQHEKIEWISIDDINENNLIHQNVKNYIPNLKKNLK